MNIAVIKPDHMGDLILSSAAIRAVAAQYPEMTLFVSPATAGLAHILFPNLSIGIIEFAHLQKSAQAISQIPDLRFYDHVVILRADGIINKEWAALRCKSTFLNDDNHHKHQSRIDYENVSELIGHYDMDALHFVGAASQLAEKAAAPALRIGCCLGSGFFANAWPLTRWLDLGRKLMRSGRDVRFIGGPAEAPAIAFLLSRLGLDANHALMGGEDFVAFFNAVSALDLVVASDGGTAHLCSLVTPVLSLFGPSPFRRYAPFGSHNRLMRYEVPCSPCCQYHKRLVNCCLTTDCMSAISVQAVCDEVDAPLTSADRPIWMHRAGLDIYTGVSHADISEE